MSARAVSDLERGVNRAPRADTFGLLVSALGLAPAERRVLEAAAHRHDGASAVAPAAGGLAQEAAPPLVGRATELAQLERHLAWQGPTLLLLAGEPGIGKSRLLQEAASRAGALGWTVLVGGCTRSGGQQPFAPLLQAMQQHLAGRLSAERRLALQGCAWLVRLLPELADMEIEPLPGWTLPAEQERRLLFEAVRRLLANVAGGAGTLLVLDDLQWAGADGLELLTTLLQQPDSRLRVVAAYRHSELPPEHPLTAVIAESGRGAACLPARGGTAATRGGGRALGIAARRDGAVRHGSGSRDTAAGRRSAVLPRQPGERSGRW